MVKVARCVPMQRPWTAGASAIGRKELRNPWAVIETLWLGFAIPLYVSTCAPFSRDAAGDSFASVRNFTNFTS